MTTAKTDTLAIAMAKAFGEIEGAHKSVMGQVGQQKYKYADLSSVIDAIKPALINNGLFFVQSPVEATGGVVIKTTLHHAGGELLDMGTLFVPANKNDAQAYGSALTYARRYALVTAFGVPTEDDDGNAASKSAPPAKEYDFPDGPATGITQMKNMTRELWREVAACGDEDTLITLLEMTEHKALIAQLEALENPAHREIWMGDGGDNPGLYGYIQRKRAEFKAALLTA